ncbi:MAG: 2,5-diamino-6-(ribosylamino)-4(3H)-pyrimidinone 5'-phosphate reductase [Anaerolineales bacterium]
MMMMRPHVHINVAMTADGKIDTIERRGAAISSPRDKERVDRLRAEADAVMVGGNTLRHEDPKLTVKSADLRAWRERRGLPPNPAKVGIASHLDLEPASAFLTAGPSRVFLFTTPQTNEAQIAMLQAQGAQVFVHDAPRVDLLLALQTLKVHGIERLMVEGGGTLNFELLRLGLVDALTLYVAPLLFGGENAPTTVAGPGLARSAAIPLRLVHVEAWEDGGVLLHYTLSVRS